MTSSANRGFDGAQIGCVIMASGLGRRFGGNKLMENLGGKPLIGHVIDKTTGLFAERVVVTRSSEVAEYCREKGVACILHEKPYRSDTVRLGITEMAEMDSCMFCPGDQPLIKRETMEKIIALACKEPGYIYRLYKNEKHGMPVVFPKKVFEELGRLPEKKGGRFVIDNHKELLKVVEAIDEIELFDIDTREDFLEIKGKFFEQF